MPRQAKSWEPSFSYQAIQSANEAAQKMSTSPSPSASTPYTERAPSASVLTTCAPEKAAPARATATSAAASSSLICSGSPSLPRPFYI